MRWFQNSKSSAKMSGVVVWWVAGVCYLAGAASTLPHTPACLRQDWMHPTLEHANA